MTTSAEIDKLAEALATAQGEFKNPTKDRVNPHFKSKYATLDSSQEATRPILGKNGLSVVQIVRPTEHYLELVTRLLHASGQWIESVIPLYQAGKGPQAFGSEMKYLRRYAYEAILNIAADEDDDGEAAQASAPTSAPERRTPPARAEKPQQPQEQSFIEKVSAALQNEGDSGKWLKLLEQAYKRASTAGDLEAISKIESVRRARTSGPSTIRAIIDGWVSDAAARFAPGEEPVRKVAAALKAEPEMAEAEDDGGFPGDRP